MKTPTPQTDPAWRGSWVREVGGVKGRERRVAIGESGGENWKGEARGDKGVKTGESGRAEGGSGGAGGGCLGETQKIGNPSKDYSTGPKVSASWVWPGSQISVGQFGRQVSGFGRGCREISLF